MSWPVRRISAGRRFDDTISIVWWRGKVEAILGLQDERSQLINGHTCVGRFDSDGDWAVLFVGSTFAVSKWADRFVPIS